MTCDKPRLNPTSSYASSMTSRERKAALNGDAWQPRMLAGRRDSMGSTRGLGDERCEGLRGLVGVQEAHEREADGIAGEPRVSVSMTEARGRQDVGALGTIEMA